MRMVRLVLRGLCASTLVLGGCTANDTLAPAVPTSLTVTALAPTVLVGESTSVRATAVANNQSVAASGVVWSSSAPATATVSADGTVTGIARGTAQIRGTLGTVSASVGITVLGVRSLAVQAPRSSLYPTQTMVLTAQLDVDPGVSPTVQWSSSNQAVATVSGSGMVTAVSPGTVTIAAGLLGQSAAVTLTVMSVPISVVSVSPSTATVIAGGTQQLTASARDSAGTVLTGRSVTWSTSAPTVATVSASGLVTAVGAGTATITATSEGKSATASVTVIPPVATVAITPTAPTVLLGGTQQLTASARDAGGAALTGRAVTWSSSAPSIATVSTMGVVTGIAPGTATITVTVEGRTATTLVTVVALTLTVTPDSVVTAVGDTVRYAVTVTPAGSLPAGSTVTWQVTDNALAAISSTGVLVARGAGVTVVAATVGGVSAQTAVRIGLNFRRQELSGRDFQNQSMPYADFSDAQMIGSYLYATDLTGARLRNANMASANLAATTFTGADLTGAILSEARFTRATKWPDGFSPAGRGLWGPNLDYSGLNLVGRNFETMDLLRAKFVGANLSSTYFRYTNLEFADLTYANLSGASLIYANLLGATLTGAVLTGVRFNRSTLWPTGFNTSGKGMFGPLLNLSGQNLAGRGFNAQDFFGCTMRGTDFSAADLTYSSLEQSDLSGAIFRGAALDYANLSGATITGAVFAGAYYNVATIWPSGFDPVAAGAIRR